MIGYCMDMFDRRIEIYYDHWQVLGEGADRTHVMKQQK